MENNEKTLRPLLVWVISILFSLMAISQLFSHTLLLLLPPSIHLPEVQATIASWSILDRLSPYILDIILLISMILLFRLKKNSTTWFSIYLGLLFLATIQQALTTSWLENFGAIGIISSLGGLAFFSVALGYMFWLKKRNILL